MQVSVSEDNRLIVRQAGQLWEISAGIPLGMQGTGKRCEPVVEGRDVFERAGGADGLVPYQGVEKSLAADLR